MRIAGHSLGGALVTMLAIDLTDHIDVPGNDAFSPEVYTFGSPTVGDKAFAGAFDKLIPVNWRIANLPVVVPGRPPIWAGYTHVDGLVPINADNRTKH